MASTNALSDKAIRGAVARAIKAVVAERLADGDGLRLDVQATGAAWWRFRYRFAGKEGMLSFGTYSSTSLSQARRLGLWAHALSVEPWLYRSGTSPVTFNLATKALAVSVTLSNRGTVFDRVFDWAEHRYPELLVNGTDNQTLSDGTIYRCYSTNFCVGYRSGQFLTYDGVVIAPVGDEAALLKLAEADGF